MFLAVQYYRPPTPMSGSGQVWQFVYTVNAASPPDYVDGDATVSITGAFDSAGNENDPVPAPLATFGIDTSQVGSNTIIAAEYFFDVDPGEGLGIPIPAPLDGTYDSATEKIEFGGIDTSDLSIGYHRLYLRMQSSEGVFDPVLPEIVTDRHFAAEAIPPVCQIHLARFIRIRLDEHRDVQVRHFQGVRDAALIAKVGKADQNTLDFLPVLFKQLRALHRVLQGLHSAKLGIFWRKRNNLYTFLFQNLQNFLPAFVCQVIREETPIANYNPKCNLRVHLMPPFLLNIMPIHICPALYLTWPLL